MAFRLKDICRKRLPCLLFLAAMAYSGVATAAPHILVPHPKRDMGVVPPSATISHIFILRNSGDELLVIRKIVPSCSSCTSTISGGNVEPGKEFRIPVKIDVSNESKVHGTKRLYIHSNDPEKKLTTLEVSYERDTLFEVKPSKFHLNGIIGDVIAKEVIVVFRKKRTVIDSIRTTKDWLVATLAKREIKAGLETVALKLTVKPHAEPGKILEEVILKTSSGEQSIIPVQGYLWLPARALPDRIVFQKKDIEIKIAHVRLLKRDKKSKEMGRVKLVYPDYLAVKQNGENMEVKMLREPVKLTGEYEVGTIDVYFKGVCQPLGIKIVFAEK